VSQLGNSVWNIQGLHGKGGLVSGKIEQDSDCDVIRLNKHENDKPSNSYESLPFSWGSATGRHRRRIGETQDLIQSSKTINDSGEAEKRTQ